MQEIFKPGLVLFLICLISSSLLGVVSEVTKKPIEERRIESEKNAQLNLFNDADEFEIISEEKNGNIQKIILAKKDNNSLGYIFNMKVKGFGGEIQMSVGISSDGKVIGYEVLKDSETPGLGSKIKDNSFINNFKNKTGPFTVVKKSPSNDNEIEAIASSTISSDAVTKAVNEAVNFFEQMK